MNYGRIALVCIFGVGLGVPAACSKADFNVPASSPSPTAAPTGTATATGSGLPSPTPSATGSAVPLACASPVAGSQFIAMGSIIAPVTDPTFGLIGGYQVVDSAGNYPLRAAPITLRPADKVQFVNVDPAAPDGTAGTSHSAAGLQQAAFPANYTFPAAAHTAVGSTMSNSTLWSSGDIPAIASDLCYSPIFTVPSTGTYYFGDAGFYTTLNMRDVLVVSGTAPMSRSGLVRRRPPAP